jgi:hypothetical protein
MIDDTAADEAISLRDFSLDGNGLADIGIELELNTSGLVERIAIDDVKHQGLYLKGQGAGGVTVDGLDVTNALQATGLTDAEGTIQIESDRNYIERVTGDCNSSSLVESHTPRQCGTACGMEVDYAAWGERVGIVIRGGDGNRITDGRFTNCELGFYSEEAATSDEANYNRLERVWFEDLQTNCIIVDDFDVTYPFLTGDDPNQGPEWEDRWSTGNVFVDIVCDSIGLAGADRIYDSFVNIGFHTSIVGLLDVPDVVNETEPEFRAQVNNAQRYAITHIKDLTTADNNCRLHDGSLNQVISEDPSLNEWYGLMGTFETCSGQTRLLNQRVVIGRPDGNETLTSLTFTNENGATDITFQGNATLDYMKVSDPWDFAFGIGYTQGPPPIGACTLGRVYLEPYTTSTSGAAEVYIGLQDDGGTCRWTLFMQGENSGGIEVHGTDEYLGEVEAHTVKAHVEAWTNSLRLGSDLSTETDQAVIAFAPSGSGLGDFDHLVEWDKRWGGYAVNWFSQYTGHYSVAKPWTGVGEIHQEVMTLHSVEDPDTTYIIGTTPTKYRAEFPQGLQLTPRASEPYACNSDRIVGSLWITTANPNALCVCIEVSTSSYDWRRADDLSSASGC